MYKASICLLIVSLSENYMLYKCLSVFLSAGHMVQILLVLAMTTYEEIQKEADPHRVELIQESKQQGDISNYQVSYDTSFHCS